MIRTVIEEKLLGELAVVSSFGAESAVLLDLVAAVDPALPVLFLDTGKMFPETLDYRDTLIRAARPYRRADHYPPRRVIIDAKDSTGLRWSYDPDGCCEIRKVIPLAAAMKDFDASITGRKGFQASTRNGIPRFELDGDRIKFNPLVDWSKADLDGWFETRDLPRHPLEAQGYLSIGCAPCTSVVKPGRGSARGPLAWLGQGRMWHPRRTPRRPGEEPVF